MTRLALLVAFSLPAHAQLDGFCLDELDGGGGLDVEIDALGLARLARVRRLSGDVVYTTIDHAGDARSEVIVARASRLGIDEIEDLDLLILEGRPHVCLYNAVEQRLEVAIRGDGPRWAREVIAVGVGAGRWCALGVVNEQLVVAYAHDGALWFARRLAPDDWATEPVDDGGPDNDAGFEIALSVAPDGTPVVAHRDRTLGRLHLSFDTGFWQTVEVSDENFQIGVRPAITHRADGRIWVLHGVVGVGLLDQESDAGLLLTGGRLPGPLTTEFIDPNQAIGGTNAIVMQPTDDGGERPVGLSRQHLRSALFPDADDVRLYDALPGGFDHTAIEAAPPAAARRAYTRVGLTLDPFGGLVASYVDDALTCLHRPLDSDADGLPDDVEPDFETNALDPDSDDDGVSDGLEVLRDRTNPNGDGPLDPDAAVPDAAVPDAAVPDAEPDAEPDAAVPDAGAPDAGAPDAGAPDAAVPDAGAPDAALPDAAVPDAAVPDASVPDASVPDAAVPDAAVPDASVPDAAVPDAAVPDAAVPDAMVPDAAVADAVADAQEAVDVVESDLGDDAADDDAARIEGDGGSGLVSDVKLDAELPPLTTFASDRGLDCACSPAAPRGGAFGWLLLLGLRRRR